MYTVCTYITKVTRGPCPALHNTAMASSTRLGHIGINAHDHDAYISANTSCWGWNMLHCNPCHQYYYIHPADRGPGRRSLVRAWDWLPAIEQFETRAFHARLFKLVLVLVISRLTDRQDRPRQRGQSSLLLVYTNLA